MIDESKVKYLVDQISQDRNVSGDSDKWANWQSVLFITTCPYCAGQHGKIFNIAVLGDKISVNAHQNCKCVYVPMRTKEAGTATDFGLFGPDMYLIMFGKLPENYLTPDMAKKYGWIDRKGNLKEVLPGMSIGGSIYENKDGKLPKAYGRIWYEADINYTEGYRNRQRLVYSNDGLIFVTYDHYHTFHEITNDDNEKTE